MTSPVIVALDDAPALAAIARALPDRYPYLLESAADGPLDRYSLLLRGTGEQLVLEEGGSIHGPGQGEDFLQRLDQWYRREALPGSGPDDMPFVGGWFLYLAYELSAQIEPALKLPPAADGLPVALAARCDGAVIVRHGAQTQCFLVAEDAAVLASMRAELEALPPEQTTALPVLSEIQPDDAARFEASVSRIHEYLLAGDVFQVNLSRAWHGALHQDPDPMDVYRSLRAANPAPFGGLMRWQDRTLLSSSPERLVEVRGLEAQTRPIAGTHPRHPDAAEDQRLAAALLAHPKEQAEHIMLIDLERNDLGRVCEPGTVEVDELMVLETYAHVHHIVSNVRGRLRSGLSPLDAVRAVFPGGTITGCPKFRCMEIIAELEQEGRGFYTGSMGYLDRYGNMDLNILIRSMLLQPGGLSFRTGAGIVADSDAQKEVAETVHKARGLLAALEGNSARSEERK